MDVTLNPLVALYFATEELSHLDKLDGDISLDGEVVAFKIPWSEVKYSESDAVSCIANLAYLSLDERRQLRKVSSLEIDDFNREPVVERLGQFIKAEKPGFSQRINPIEIGNTYFVNPRDSNNRMIAQAGKFLIYGERVGYENVSKDFDVKKFNISADAKERIRDELDKLSINGRTLFPEVESAAKYIKAKFFQG